jgi:hypothetical protein
MRFALLTLLLGLGCSAAGEAGLASDVSQPAQVRALVWVEPEVAEPAQQALDMWAAATDGAFTADLTSNPELADLRIVLTSEMCEGFHEPLSGCYGAGLVRVNVALAPELRASTIAHELGHALGQPDSSDGLMNPRRSNAERLNPCVDAAVALGGPGTCELASAPAAR